MSNPKTPIVCLVALGAYRGHAGQLDGQNHYALSITEQA